MAEITPQSEHKAFETNFERWERFHNRPEPKYGRIKRWIRRNTKYRNSKIGVYPATSGPYFKQIFLGFENAGAFFPIRSARDFAALQRDQNIDVLHINWEERFILNTPHSQQHRKAIQICEHLKALLVRGVQLVLTVHNDLPHEPCDQEAFRYIRGFLADHARLIHVHSHVAKNLMINQYGASEDRIFIVEHPSYVGFYPPAAEQKHNEKPKLLSFGAVRKYKGHDFLLRSIAKTKCADKIGGLTIAGAPRTGVEVDISPAKGLIPIQLDLRSIPDDELPALFGHHDYSVLSYTSGLTSGVAMLALSFGKPVIAPDIGGMREMLGLELSHFLYPVNNEDALARALDKAAELPQAERIELGKIALNRAQETHPYFQSKALLRAYQQQGLWTPKGHAVAN